MIYLVTYDLNSPGQKHKEITERIENSGLPYAHILTTTWLVATKEHNANTIYDNLQDLLDKNDYLFVTAITPTDMQGFLDEDMWNWINSAL